VHKGLFILNTKEMFKYNDSCKHSIVTCVLYHQSLHKECSLGHRFSSLHLVNKIYPKNCCILSNSMFCFNNTTCKAASFPNIPFLVPLSDACTRCVCRTLLPWWMPSLDWTWACSLSAPPTRVAAVGPGAAATATAAAAAAS
jgi:hypothetical protein